MNTIRTWASKVGEFGLEISNYIGRAREAEAQTILDEISTQVLTDTMRFKDGLVANPDYDNFVSEDGSKGLFAEHRKKMQDYAAERTKDKPWIRDRAENIINKFLVSEESNVRKLQTQRMVDVGFASDLGSMSTLLEKAQGDEFNFVFHDKYAELKKRYSDFMLPEYFDAEFQKAAGNSLSKLIDNGMDTAIKEGGRAGLNAYLEQINGPNGNGLTPVDFQGLIDAGLDDATLIQKGEDPAKYRDAQKAFMGPAIVFDDDKIKAQADKKYEAYRIAQEAGYEQALIGSFFEKKDLPGTVGILASNQFKEYAGIDTQEKWWGRLQNEIDKQSAPPDSKYQKELDDMIQKEWLNLMSTGKTMDSPSVRNFMLSTAKLASADVESRITKEWKNWDYGFNPQVDTILQGVVKDKTITDEAMRGEILLRMRNEFQSLRNKDVDYAKIANMVKEDVKKEKYTKLVTELASAGFGGADFTVSATEDMQMKIQDGAYRNAVRAVEVSGVDKDIFQVKEGMGYITPDQKTMAMHWQTQYKMAKETFDLAPQGTETRVSRGDPYIPDGQLIFKEADGTEYAFMIPSKTEKGKKVYEKDERIYKITNGKEPELVEKFVKKEARAKKELTAIKKEEKKVQTAAEREAERLEEIRLASVQRQMEAVVNPPDSWIQAGGSAYTWNNVRWEDRAEWIQKASKNWKLSNGITE